MRGGRERREKETVKEEVRGAMGEGRVEGGVMGEKYTVREKKIFLTKILYVRVV